MKLHFGVLDLPYADAASYKEVKRRKPRTQPGGSKTTGDVATILEEKYHVMETFFELYQPRIGDAMAESFKNAFESILMGAPPTLDPGGAAMAEIEDLFRQMLAKEELNGVIGGVPTEAAKRGVSHRFKQPYKKRDPRPSFIDTGLYEGSMRAWLEED